MLRPLNLSYDALGRASFTAVLEGEPLGDFRLNVPSEANMLDALAVICVCHIRGLDMAKVAEALASFVGAKASAAPSGASSTVLLDLPQPLSASAHSAQASVRHNSFFKVIPPS